MDSSTHGIETCLAKFKRELVTYTSRSEDKKSVNLIKLKRALTLLELLDENSEAAIILLKSKIKEEEARKDEEEAEEDIQEDKPKKKK